MATLSNQVQIKIIDSVSALQAALEYIASLPTEPPSIFIDLEGIKLSRNGSISILSIYATSNNTVYLLDVHQLGADSFSLVNTRGVSLKNILESSTTPKVIFDVRNDSDALFKHFQISLHGVQDLQLMELASRPRPGSGSRVNSLSRCVEYDSGIYAIAKAEWQRIKEAGTRLFAPEKGWNYQVFNDRPLKPELVQYCAQDVSLLPKLYDVYYAKLCTPDKLFWLSKVRSATQDRIKTSQSAGYDPHSRNKAFDR